MFLVSFLYQEYQGTDIYQSSEQQEGYKYKYYI